MIYLYGKLKKKFGNNINIKVNSVSELMKAVEANRPGFRDAIDKDRHYLIRRGSNFKKGKDINDQELELKFKDTDWHVLPLACGSGGGGGFLTTILGVALSVVGVVTGQLWLTKIGIGIALMGVSAMLAPSPPVNNYTDREKPDSRPSYLFNGPLNRTAAGGAVSLVYGKDVFVGSIFTSGSFKIGAIA